MTTLVKWTPFRELDLMERRMRRLLEDMGFGPLTTPAADIYETAEEFVVEIEVPGFAEDELEVQVADHTLTVKGEAKEEKEKRERTFLLHERLERSFERRFQLPEEADTEKVTAVFSKGLLEIHAPKAGRAQAKKVPIEAK
jgi:HSP20 family protein